MIETSRWIPERRMLWGFVLTGAVTVVVQMVFMAAMGIAWFSLQDFAPPVTPVESFAVNLAVQTLLAATSAWISWRVLRHERRAGHPLSVIDAAAGPLAVSLVFGLPYVMLHAWFLALPEVGTGLQLSTTGYYLSARIGGRRMTAVAPPPETTAAASPDSNDGESPLDWRLIGRRMLFLLGGSLIVSGVFTVVLKAVYLRSRSNAVGVLWESLMTVTVLVVLSLPVVFTILAVFNVTPRLTWIRAVGGAAIANGVLLPFGYAVLAPLSFDYVRGAIWLGALVIGSLVVHPLALLIEQATASRAAGRRRPAPGRVS